MAATRKTSLNARQRARMALQDDLEKLKKREDLLVEVLTAADARDAAEVRLGEALHELRGLGMSQAEMAERTGLVTREISAAMRMAHQDEELERNEDDQLPDADTEGSDESEDQADDQIVETDDEDGQPVDVSAKDALVKDEEPAASGGIEGRSDQPVATV